MKLISLSMENKDPFILDIINSQYQCSKLMPVPRSEIDKFSGGLGNFSEFCYHFMFELVLKSLQDGQTIWLKFENWSIPEWSWPVEARNQDISSHNIDTTLPGYSSISLRGIKFWANLKTFHYRPSVWENPPHHCGFSAQRASNKASVIMAYHRHESMWVLHYTWLAPKMIFPEVANSKIRRWCAHYSIDLHYDFRQQLNDSMRSQHLILKTNCTRAQGVDNCFDLKNVMPWKLISPLSQQFSI